jgi:death-on-curing protein
VTDRVWIDEALARAVHERMLLWHGGAPGLRDPGMLQSALARPRQRDAYGDDPDLARLAAACTSGIIQNPPFVDGNKRTGFVLGVLFLELNGGRFTASEEAAAGAVMMLAAGGMNEAGYAGFLRGSLGV